MNFNDPINQNASHPVSNLRLVLHVQRLGLIVHFCPQIVVHDILREFGHILRILRILTITFLDGLGY